MKNFWIVVLVLLGLVIGVYLYRNKLVVYSLPRTHDPETFGPNYWKAIHSLVNKVPCPSCREDGKSLFVFAHDVVNKKIGKPIFDQQNYNKWKDHICEGKKIE